VAGRRQTDEFAITLSHSACIACRQAIKNDVTCITRLIRILSSKINVYRTYGYAVPILSSCVSYRVNHIHLWPDLRRSRCFPSPLVSWEGGRPPISVPLSAWHLDLFGHPNLNYWLHHCGCMRNGLYSSMFSDMRARRAPFVGREGRESEGMERGEWKGERRKGRREREWEERETEGLNHRHEFLAPPLVVWLPQDVNELQKWKRILL